MILTVNGKAAAVPQDAESYQHLRNLAADTACRAELVRRLAAEREEV